MLFVYRIKEDDRDCCAYIDDGRGCIGSTSIGGPNYWISFGKRFGGEEVPYDLVETVLTEEEYNNTRDFGYTTEILEKLRTPEAVEFADQIMEDEFSVIMRENGISAEDASYLLENYPLAFRDRGIVGCVFDDWDQAAYEEAWGLGYLENIDERYFDFSAFANDLEQDEWYLELPSGQVVRYSM